MFYSGELKIPSGSIAGKHIIKISIKLPDKQMRKTKDDSKSSFVFYNIFL